MPGAELAIAAYAHDADLLDRCRAAQRACARLLAWPSVAVVLGRASKPALELHLAAVQAAEVPVYRRAGGGCAVVLDDGNLIFSLALPLAGLGQSQATFAQVTTLLGASLAQVGAPGVQQRGISDLAVGEQKVGGACIYRQQGLLYYTTTLLVRPRLDLVERYLAHPPREPDYRRGRGHRTFMGSLPFASAGALQAALREPLGARLATVYNGVLWP